MYKEKEMFEFRQNLVTREWVLIAADEGRRPRDFLHEDTDMQFLREHADDCSYCPGNETRTAPPESVLRGRSGWKIRVIPDKFALIRKDLSPTRTFEGKYIKASGYGISETVIETPLHNKSPGAMTRGEIQDILNVYLQRYDVISKEYECNLITIFKKRTINGDPEHIHAHSKIIALPIVPFHVRATFREAMFYFDYRGSCVYCHIVAEELAQKVRIVQENKHFISFCPFASRVPYEVRILPKRHCASFNYIGENEIPDFAEILQDILYRLEQILPHGEYSYIIRSAPVGEEGSRYLHWFLSIEPKIPMIQDMNSGLNVMVNPFPPEECARELRKVPTR
jgi:UDPglucose--hexose-1-phosphate uridylyltransferase